MKKQLIHILDLLILLSMLCVVSGLFFTGCQDEVKRTMTYTVNEPVYMPFAEFRARRPLQPAQDLVNPGKICLYGDYLFINEIGKGIHVINNSDPSAPQPAAFIELPGNIDIIAGEGLLYADSYADLVWFDISDPAAAAEAGRLTDVFRNVWPATGNDYPVLEIDDTKGVVVGWEVKTITVDEEIRHYPYPCPYCSYVDVANSWAVSGTAAQRTAAMAGSMARFATHGNYLYVANDGKLSIFNLSGKVNKVGEQYLSWNVETIFAYDDKLFFGTTTGMLIYDIANPVVPKHLSSLTHVLGCDPVVVQDNYAYVTVRGGNACGQSQSLLSVVDISNPAAPVTKSIYGMHSPYGLGIDGNTLFVCDNGLKVFDATIPADAGYHLLKHFSDISGFDVIPYNNVLILVGSGGLYQYDYSDLQDIRLLSVLNVQQ